MRATKQNSRVVPGAAVLEKIRLLILCSLKTHRYVVVVVVVSALSLSDEEKKEQKQCRSLLSFSFQQPTNQPNGIIEVLRLLKGRINKEARSFCSFIFANHHLCIGRFSRLLFSFILDFFIATW
jgi:hypothetical protein